jgi:hypothetical protein
MRFFTNEYGFIVEWTSFKSYLQFLFGQICGTILFFFLGIPFIYVIMYWCGYVESLDPLINLLKHIF